MELKGNRTYILCGLVIAWAIGTTVVDLGISTDTRDAVLVSLLGAVGIAMRACIANGAASVPIPKSRGRKK